MTVPGLRVAVDIGDVDDIAERPGLAEQRVVVELGGELPDRVAPHERAIVALPGIARVASETIRNSVASTGARNAIPPMSRMSSDPARSVRSAMMKNSGATTSPCWTIWSSAPCAPAASPSAKTPSVMKPSCATDE